MKNKGLLLIITLFLFVHHNTNQAAGATPTDMNAWFDNYGKNQTEYSQELLAAGAEEAKAEQDMAASSPDFSDAVNQIQLAYAQDPVGALATILDPSVTKSTLLTTAQLEQLGQAAGLTPSQATDYASGKFADPQGIMQLLKNGFKTANIADVSNGLNLIKASSPSSSLDYDLILDLKVEISDPSSSLYTRMVNSFTPDQVKTILANASIDSETSEYVYMRSLGNNITNALDNTDIDEGLSQITSSLQNLSKIDPSFAKELFQNGNPLGKDTLMSTYESKYTSAQLSEMAQAAGLSTTDITSYLQGAYTGAGELPDGPGGTVTPGTNPHDSPSTGNAGNPSMVDNKEYQLAKESLATVTQAEVSFLETTYIQQASKIVQSIKSLDINSPDYAENLSSLKEELETANARAQAAEDVASAKQGTEPVDVVQTPDIA